MREGKSYKKGLIIKLMQVFNYKKKNEGRKKEGNSSMVQKEWSDTLAHLVKSLECNNYMLYFILCKLSPAVMRHFHSDIASGRL